jgi:hypothetical protein
MRSRLTCFVFILALLACGAGVPYHPAKVAACENGFVNDSNIPTGDPADPYIDGDHITAETSTLWDLWRIEQIELSTQPVYYPYLNPHYQPPLAEAATEQPHCAHIVSVPAQAGVGFACAGQRVGGCVVDGVVYTASYNTWRSSYEIGNLILCRYGRCVGR